MYNVHSSGYLLFSFRYKRYKVHAHFFSFLKKKYWKSRLISLFFYTNSPNAEHQRDFFYWNVLMESFAFTELAWMA